MKKFTLLCGIGAMLLGAALSARAVGILVSPAALVIDTKVAEEATVRVRVTNPGAAAALFEAVSENYPEAIRTFPSSFTLESGEARDIVVRVVSNRAGVIETKLLVSARPLAGELQLGGGVKLPLTIKTTGRGRPFAAMLFSGAYLPWTLLVVMTLVFGSLEVRRRMRA